MTSQDSTATASKKQRFNRLIALALVMSVIAAACGSAASDTISLSEDGLTPTGSEVETDSAEPAGDLVEFNYESFDGEQLTFTDFAEGPVVVNFFASWCATCVAELPEFETVSQNFAGEVQFLGLSVQEEAQLSVDLLERTGVTFPTGLDQPGEIFAQFGGLGMPTTVFINGDGTIAKVHTGVLTEESLTEEIETNLFSS